MLCLLGFCPSDTGLLQCYTLIVSNSFVLWAYKGRLGKGRKGCNMEKQVHLSSWASFLWGKRVVELGARQPARVWVMLCSIGASISSSNPCFLAHFLSLPADVVVVVIGRPASGSSSSSLLAIFFPWFLFFVHNLKWCHTWVHCSSFLWMEIKNLTRLLSNTSSCTNLARLLVFSHGLKPPLQIKPRWVESRGLTNSRIVGIGLQQVLQSCASHLRHCTSVAMCCMGLIGS